MGLLQPHGRYGDRDEQAHLGRWLRPASRSSRCPLPWRERATRGPELSEGTACRVRGEHRPSKKDSANHMKFLTLDDLAVAGKRVLVRADLNVPVKDGKVTDATRIERQAPTIRELAEKGARVIVLSHFDRPKGKVVPAMSLRPLVEPLSQAVGRSVAFAEDCIGAKAKAVVDKLKPGDVALLENTRFHPGEEKNDPEFAR